MLAIGDPGLTTVEIVVPKGFEVELVGEPMRESERDGQQVFTAEGIADPDSWFVDRVGPGRRQAARAHGRRSASKRWTCSAGPTTQSGSTSPRSR